MFRRGKGKGRRTKSTKAIRRQADRVEAENRLARAKTDKTEISTRRKAAGVRAKALSTYAAAEKNRLNNDWRPKRKSADQAVIADLATMNPRARMACRDDWAGKSARAAFVRHVVGTGITPRADARDPDSPEQKLLTEFNQAITDRWGRWTRDPAACDIEGRKDFLGIQRLIARELFAVGEILVLAVVRDRNGTKELTIQLIEGEQLDTSTYEHEGREVRGGVEIDEYGAAVAYHVYTTVHPLETFSPKSNPTRIPADRVLHVIDPERVRQTRGVTRLSAVLKRLWHLGMYDEYELVAKKGEACIGGFIKQDLMRPDAMLGVGGGSGDTGQDDATKQNEQWNFEPFMLPRLGPGEDFGLVNPQRPGAVYGPYTQQQITQSAAGAGLDFATVARDFSKGTFSSQRQGLIETWDELDPQQLILVNLALRQIRDLFVEVEVLAGRVKAPRFFTDKRWNRAYKDASWQPSAKRWIDPAKRAAAEKIKLDAGLTSRQRVLNELGIDWRALFREIAEAKRFADELGIQVPGLNAPSKTAPAEPRPGRKQPEEKDEAGGDEDDGLSAAIERAVISDAIGETAAEAAMAN